MDDKTAGRIAKRLRKSALAGTWDGRRPNDYFFSCRYADAKRGFVAIFTRDVGHHSSGWWKNPDYERCFHLSLSFVDSETLEPRLRDAVATKRMLDAFFGTNKRLLWCEPPYSDNGKKLDVWHYRLFCDPGWNPIKPRGEVYSKFATELGWKSFSDVQHALEIEANAQLERLLNR